MDSRKQQGWLESSYSTTEPLVELPDRTCEIVNLPFFSRAATVLPGPGEYPMPREPAGVPVDGGSRSVIWEKARAFLSVPDQEIQANREFNYMVFRPRNRGRAERAILLLHGLNERSWDKYLEWAARLVGSLGRPVVLFPIAFHINRTPAGWNNPRLMQRIALERRRLVPSDESSFANAAISTRLETIPQRFFFSCLQTVRDIQALLDEIEQGAHLLLAPHCRIDFFAYSVGAFLTQVLLMGDTAGRLARSRVVLFCGGATFDLMNPVSKYILDGEGYKNLRGFLLDRFEEEASTDPKLRPHFQADDPDARAFRLLLDSRRGTVTRERALKSCADRVLAITLDRDTVVPPDAVAKTVAGTGIRHERQDLSYPYRHENPFPRIPDRAARKSGFDAVFRLAEEWMA